MPVPDLSPSQPSHAVDIGCTNATFADPAVRDTPGLSAIRLDPLDCMRLVWPMELVLKSDVVDHPYIRIRQGANRFAKPGTGVCEWAFETKRAAVVTIFLHCRAADECSNSVLCRNDGGPATFVEIPPPFGSWTWVPLYRRFSLPPGIHRLSLMALEDGLDIDGIVLAATENQPLVDPRAVCERATHKPPPVFEKLPMVAPTLPAIGALTTEAFPAESLVIGASHRNSLGVYLRLNGAAPASGTVRIESERGHIQLARDFSLSQDKRSELLMIPLQLQPNDFYLIPVSVEISTAAGLVGSQRIDFINPLAWAFLGPFFDREGKGLDAPLPPEEQLLALGALPAFPGMTWKVVPDGSCYDEFGVIDLNRVFGLPSKAPVQDPPLVAYAVTRIPHGFRNPHESLAYGGDDGLRVWLNGREIARADTGCPLEMNRMLMGTAMAPGGGTFVFKITQLGGYWQLLFEPECISPYGQQESLRVMPIDQWKLPASALK
ncbi:MAG: hypothetical protein WCR06_06735 [bacterium]